MALTGRRARLDCGEALPRQGHWSERRSGQVAIDKSDANKAAIAAIKAGRGVPILVRQGPLAR